MKKFLFLLALIPMLACQPMTSQTQVPVVRFPAVSVTNGAITTVVKTFPVSSFPSGTIVANFQGTTGGTGCTWNMQFYTGSTFVTVAPPVFPIAGVVPTGVQVMKVGFNPGLNSAAPLIGMYGAGAVNFSCSTFPTSGQVFFEFQPDTKPSYWPFHINNTATNNSLKTTSAELHTITVNNPGTAWVMTIVDTASVTCTGGTTIAVLSPTTAAVGQALIFDVTTQSGLCIATSGTTAGDITVTVR